MLGAPHSAQQTPAPGYPVECTPGSWTVAAPRIGTSRCRRPATRAGCRCCRHCRRRLAAATPARPHPGNRTQQLTTRAGNQDRLASAAERAGEKHNSPNTVWTCSSRERVPLCRMSSSRSRETWCVRAHLVWGRHQHWRRPAALCSRLPCANIWCDSFSSCCPLQAVILGMFTVSPDMPRSCHCMPASLHAVCSVGVCVGPVKWICSGWPDRLRTPNPGCSVTRQPTPTRATATATARTEPSWLRTWRRHTPADSTCCSANKALEHEPVCRRSHSESHCLCRAREGHRRLGSSCFLSRVGGWTGRRAAVGAPRWGRSRVGLRHQVPPPQAARAAGLLLPTRAARSIETACRSGRDTVVSSSKRGALRVPESDSMSHGMHHVAAAT